MTRCARPRLSTAPRLPAPPGHRGRLAALGAVLLLASCASVDTPATLPEGRWELAASSLIEGSGMKVPPRATLEIRGSRISVFSGCNTGNGSVRLADGRMALSPLATTRRACAEPLATFENRYFKLLSGHPDFRTDDGMLILFAGDDSLRFRRAADSAANP